MKFQKYSSFKKLALKNMINILPENEEKKNLTKAFDKLDAKKDGAIDINEIEQAIRNEN